LYSTFDRIDNFILIVLTMIAPVFDMSRAGLMPMQLHLGPALWCLRRLFDFARYSYRSRIQ